MMTALLLLLAADPKPWRAGVATRVITPEAPMWMAGYAGRTKPAEGKEHDLYVKALALEDPDGRPAVLVTTDLIGLPRSLARRVRKRLKLDDARLMLTSSHTHCGPVVADILADMYPMPADELKKVRPYTDRLEGLIVEAVEEAMKGLKPARLATGVGEAGFAVNRREVTAKGVINGRNPDGPVDHEVPVLRVTSPDGELVAVAFGYACHNTTLPYLKWCGDYAGFAQLALESEHKGAVALFWAGCGADANPLPRGKVELAEKYGKQLADAVGAVLKGKMADVTGALSAGYREVALDYDRLPTKEEVAAALLSKSLAERRRAERQKAGGIEPKYEHYPVQVWRLGGVTWVALGGEVVVDYSRRLKKELGGKVWVTAYANDVMAYIPSERVLKEGGYEADSSMVYYGLPSKWAAGVEGRIVGAVKGLAK